MVFLANRENLQARRLHSRIQQRLAGPFTDVRTGRADPRDPGPYRVVGQVEPRGFLDVDEYPVSTARVEVGFRLRTADPYEHYWFNWIEPARNVLVGWHRDDTHDDLGPVHLQVTHSERKPTPSGVGVSDSIARQSTRYCSSGCSTASSPVSIISR